MNKTTQQAYAHCQKIAASHYENFPVASFLLPKKIRQPVAAIYAFARAGDDWADEGDWPEEKRLSELDRLDETIKHAVNHQLTDEPITIALSDTITRHQLPPQLFHDLISAFRQDVTKKRYANFGEVMDYCKRSANPVGRLLLHLTQNDNEENLAFSDAVCSALQLINFYQDLSQDHHEMGRIYIPQDELEQFHVNEEEMHGAITNPNVTRLMQHQYARADRLLRSGAALGGKLNGRFGLEIRAIILGGARTLYRLKQQNNVFSRPRLTQQDRLAIIWGALFPSKKRV